MKLDDYLKKNALTDSAFGELIKRDRSSVSRLRRGETLPDWKTMHRISEATNGAVRPDDFLPFRPEEIPQSLAPAAQIVAGMKGAEQ